MASQLRFFRMKRKLPFIIYPAVGLLAGWTSVKTLATGKIRKPETNQSRAEIKDKRETTPLWKGEDFFQAALKQMPDLSKPIITPLAEMLADWTDTEIRAALNEALQAGDTLTKNGGSAALLLREYIRRDPDSVLEWYQQIPPIHQANLLLTLSHAWPDDRALEGLDFLRKNKSLFTSNYAVGWSIVSKCIAKKAEAGPSAVVSFLRDIQQEGFSLRFGNNIAYPAGFDFAGLLETEDFKDAALGDLRATALTSWRSQNRDAAFTWVAEHGTGQDLVSIGSYREDSTPNQTEWFIKNLARTSPEQRVPLMEAKFPNWIQNTGSDATRWIEMAPTEELKNEFRTVVAQGLFFKHATPALQVIEGIPQVEDRLRFMETLVASSMPHSTPTPLTTGDEKIVREKLSEWGVAQARADAIVNLYKNPTKP